VQFEKTIVVNDDGVPAFDAALIAHDHIGRSGSGDR